MADSKDTYKKWFMLLGGLLLVIILLLAFGIINKAVIPTPFGAIELEKIANIISAKEGQINEIESRLGSMSNQELIDSLIKLKDELKHYKDEAQSLRDRLKDVQMGSASIKKDWLADALNFIFRDSTITAQKNYPDLIASLTTSPGRTRVEYVNDPQLVSANRRLKQDYLDAQDSLGRQIKIIENQGSYINSMKGAYKGMQDSNTALHKALSDAKQKNNETATEMGEIKKEIDGFIPIKITNAKIKSRCTELNKKRLLNLACVKLNGLRLTFRVENINPAQQPKTIKPNKTGSVYVLIRPPGEAYSNPLAVNYTLDADNDYKIPSDLLNKRGDYEYVLRRTVDGDQLFNSQFTIN